MKMSQEQKTVGPTCEATNPFEMVQHRIDAVCDRIKINEACHLRLREVLEMSQSEKVGLREAVYVLVLKRIADAMQSRGIFP